MSRTADNIAVVDETGEVNKKGGEPVEMREEGALAHCQPEEEASPSGPWLSARLRSKKRKNVSISPEKIPGAKKVANDATTF